MLFPLTIPIASELRGIGWIGVCGKISRGRLKLLLRRVRKFEVLAARVDRCNDPAQFLVLRAASFAPAVWETWNAKSHVAQRDDALAADAALLASLAATADADRDSFAMSMGPMTLGFTEFVAMRLNEHAFHTWDIEVAVNPTTGLPPQVAELVVDNLELVARYTAKPTGNTTTFVIATTQPERDFTLQLTADAVTFEPGHDGADPNLELPAEAFARLVYGRLDPVNTPSGVQGEEVDTLRRVFPGP